MALPEPRDVATSVFASASATAVGDHVSYGEVL